LLSREPHDIYCNKTKQQALLIAATAIMKNGQIWINYFPAVAAIQYLAARIHAQHIYSITYREITYRCMAWKNTAMKREAIITRRELAEHKPMPMLCDFSGCFC